MEGKSKGRRLKKKWKMEVGEESKSVGFGKEETLIRGMWGVREIVVRIG